MTDSSSNTLRIIKEYFTHINLATWKELTDSLKNTYYYNAAGMK